MCIIQKKKEHNLQHCEGRPYDLGDVKGLTFSKLSFWKCVVIVVNERGRKGNVSIQRHHYVK